MSKQSEREAREAREAAHDVAHHEKGTYPDQSRHDPVTKATDYDAAHPDAYRNPASPGPDPRDPMAEGPGGNARTVTKVDISHELEAIRHRLAARRRELAPGGSTTRYTSTDLADAEWLLVELDSSLGHADCLTPGEQYELNVLIDKRRLGTVDQAAMDRLSAKHGELAPDDLVMRDHLAVKQDALLSPGELERFKFLTDRAKKYEGNDSQRDSNYQPQNYPNDPQRDPNQRDPNQRDYPNDPAHQSQQRNDLPRDPNAGAQIPNPRNDLR